MTAGEELLYDTLNLLSELRQARADLADLRARAERAEGWARAWKRAATVTRKIERNTKAALRTLRHTREQYQPLIPVLRDVARAHGYALGIHGSEVRDLDVIAAPWIEAASAPDVLVEAMRVAVGGFMTNDDEADPFDYTRRNPEPKPHDRLAYAIHLRIPNGRHYIDVSVMPPRAEAANRMRDLELQVRHRERQIADLVTRLAQAEERRALRAPGGEGHNAE